jgi:hypothetical protein
VLPTEDEVDRIYAIAYDAYREALKAYEEISGKSKEIAAELQVCSRQSDTLQEILRRNDERVRNSRHAVTSALECLGLVFDEGVEDVVQRLVEETQAALDELASRIEFGVNMERSVALKRTALNTLREAKDGALEAFNSARDAENNAIQLITTAEAVIADKSASAAETMTALEEMIGDYDCITIDWRVDPAAYQKELQILAEEYLALQRIVSEMAHEVQGIQIIYAGMSDLDAQIVEVMPEWGNVTAEAKAKLDNPLGKANAILADSRTCKAQIAEVSRRIAECKDVISEYLRSQETVDMERLASLAGIQLARITALNKRLEEIRTSVAAAKSALEEHKRSQAALENDKPQFAEGEGKDDFNDKVDKGLIDKKYYLTSGYHNTYGRLERNNPSTTITNNLSTPSALRCIHYDQHRALTPREGARIQSFPDWYHFAGNRSDVTKQVGNAVPPLMAIAFANKILKVLNK